MSAVGPNDRVDLVCFGMLCQGYLLVVESPPVHNGGTVIREVREYFGDDATIIAMLLRGWDVSSGIVGTAVGDDDSGRVYLRPPTRMAVGCLRPAGHGHGQPQVRHGRAKLCGSLRSPHSSP